ncbi:hypothetical protein HXZ66_02955 [Bacillus sp. A116_S68]|nr:hypothetical protein HXZ66_02955 [Bacillus sp. A116_S68]
MISPSNRALAVELILEANQTGARLAKACEELHISIRTYEHWVAMGDLNVDQHPLTKRPVQKNKLSEEEKEEIKAVVKQEEFVDLPTDTNCTKTCGQRNLHCVRIHILSCVTRRKNATSPNQVWAWDITWLGGALKGL